MQYVPTYVQALSQAKKNAEREKNFLLNPSALLSPNKTTALLIIFKLLQSY